MMSATQAPQAPETKNSTQQNADDNWPVMQVPEARVIDEQSLNHYAVEHWCDVIPSEASCPPSHPLVFSWPHLTQFQQLRALPALEKISAKTPMKAA